MSLAPVPSEEPSDEGGEARESERIRWVEKIIFTATFAPDCMTHECRCLDENAKLRLDACCQHGADVDLAERDAIHAKAAAIAAVLDADARDPAKWFDEAALEIDPEFPSGAAVRTAVHNGGCLFLSHDGRGCALHRAALANGFTPESIKPAVCRLYPLAFGGGTLGLSDDYARYSCADHDGGPTVYRLQRDTIADVFGASLVARLDRLEKQILSRRLPLAV